MGKFIIKKNQGTTQFVLYGGNGKPIAYSLPFSSTTACKRCVQSVIRTAPIAKLQDLCPRTPQPPVTNPKFELFRDKAGAYCFQLKARNGEVILKSSCYTSKASCKSIIKSVQNNVIEPVIQFLEEDHPSPPIKKKLQ